MTARVDAASYQALAKQIVEVSKKIEQGGADESDQDKLNRLAGQFGAASRGLTETMSREALALSQNPVVQEARKKVQSNPFFADAIQADSKIDQSTFLAADGAGMSQQKVARGKIQSGPRVDGKTQVAGPGTGGAAKKSAAEAKADAVTTKIADDYVRRQETVGLLEQQLAAFDKRMAETDYKKFPAMKKEDQKIRAGLKKEIDQLKSVLPTLQLEAEGMQGAAVKASISEFREATKDLTENQRLALAGWFGGDKATKEAKEALKAMPPEVKTRLEEKRKVFKDAVGKAPEPEKHLYAAMLAGDMAGAAEHLKSMKAAEDAAAAAAAGGAAGAVAGAAGGPGGPGGPPVDPKDIAASLPEDLRRPYQEFMEAQTKAERQRDLNYGAMMGLLNSGLSIESMIFLFMAMFSDNQEEKVRLKMKEIAFSEAVERNTAKMDRLRKLRDETYGSAIQQGKSPEEAQKLVDSIPELKGVDFSQDVSKFVKVKSVQVLMQELQVETNRLSQMMQALAGALRAFQDLISTIVRNIR